MTAYNPVHVGAIGGGDGATLRSAAKAGTLKASATPMRISFRMIFSPAPGD